MKFTQKTLKGRFQKRYNRFFADVELDGQIIIAHVANTGSLKSCLYPGEQALLSPASNPERKLRFTLEALQTPWGAWVGVNTAWPNQLAKYVFEQKAHEGWKSFTTFKAEHKISKETRLDALLTDTGGRQRFVEVKNVTLASGDCSQGRGIAHFPDAVTERGKKHLEELIELVGAGHEAEMIFVVQRTDCAKFQPAWDIDPEYSRTLIKAVEAGVHVSIWPVQVTDEGFVIATDKALPLDLTIPADLPAVGKSRAKSAKRISTSEPEQYAKPLTGLAAQLAAKKSEAKVKALVAKAKPSSKKSR